MRTDHNGLVYRCFVCKERFARLTESTGCNHDGARMSIEAADYIDRLEKELQNANAKIVELQALLQ